MPYVDDIKHFLSGMSASETTVTHSARTQWPFVTISRQAGAGGHRLADTLINCMEREQDSELFQGWQICDQHLCETLAQDPNLQVSMQSLLTEEYRSQIQSFILSLLGSQADQNLVMRKMFEMIRSLAKVGKVIIVGRGGSQVTKGLELGVHIRLVAPQRLRIQRMGQLLGQNEGEAKQIMQKRDNDRARLLKSFFFADIDDPLLYDCVWNSGTAPFEVIATALIDLLKQRMTASTGS
jgi:cytidylate kinase